MKGRLYATVISDIFIFWLCCFSDARAGPTFKRNNVDEKLLEDVLTSLEKVVDFFGEDFSGINMDGLYGLRIGQGRVIETLEDCNSDDFTCPAEVVHRLEVVRDKLKLMTDNALPYVEEDTPEYAFTYIHNIEAPFHVKYIPEWLGDAIGPVGHDKGYSGSLGDACFAGMMGTAIDNKGDNILSLFPKCTLDDVCWTLMTKPNTYDYYITHQLLYFIYGEASGCSPTLSEILNEFNGGSIRDIERDLCGRIFSESKMLSKDGTVEEMKHDLFIEQSMVCGMLGFQDFFTEDWIRMVMSWQTPKGCWTTPQFVEVLRKKQKMEDIIDALKHKGTGRKLLTEALMSGDCLSHETGLAAGTLGVYTRYLVYELYRQD